MISSVGSLLPVIVEVAAAVFVLVLAQTRAVGRARTSGVVGAALIIAGVVSTTIFGLLLARRMTMEAMVSVYTLLLIENTARVLLLGAGILMLVRCVILSHRNAPENSAWQGNPAAAPYATGQQPNPGPNPYGPQSYPPNTPNNGQPQQPGPQQPGSGPQQPGPYG